MNKQEQIEKLVKILCDDDTPYEDKLVCDESCCLKDGKCTLYYPTAESVVQAGYIKGADFVEWMKDKYGELFYVVGYAYREKLDLDKALQEYLKGE